MTATVIQILMPAKKSQHQAKPSWSLKLILLGAKKYQTFFCPDASKLEIALPHKWPRKLTGSFQVVVNFISDKKMLALNKQYRSLDKTTDVLAFPLSSLLDFPEPKKGRSDLGEIFISYQQAKKQSRKYKHSEQQEIRILLIHGLMHLLGFDHQNSAEKKFMLEQTEKILTILS